MTIFASASFEYINTSRSTLRLRIVMIISTSGSSNTLKRQYSRAVTVDLSVRMTGLQMDNGTTDRTARLTTRSKQIVFCKCKNSLHCFQYCAAAISVINSYYYYSYYYYSTRPTSVYNFSTFLSHSINSNLTLRREAQFYHTVGK